MKQKAIRRIMFLVMAGFLLCQWVHSSDAREKGGEMGENQSQEISLQAMIERVNDERQRAILFQFESRLQEGDTTSVTEYEDHYEIIVVHAPEDGYTGGAEGYLLDKETGKVEMIWHEHPMELPELD